MKWFFCKVVSDSILITISVKTSYLVGGANVDWKILLVSFCWLCKDDEVNTDGYGWHILIEGKAKKFISKSNIHQFINHHRIGVTWKHDNRADIIIMSSGTDFDWNVRQNSSCLNVQWKPLSCSVTCGVWRRLIKYRDPHLGYGPSPQNQSDSSTPDLP